MTGKNDFLVIGLTGGIASGKSTVSKLCSSKGAISIDADIYGHKAYQIGSDAYHEIIETFGERVIKNDSPHNKEINRRVLGSIVFSSKAEMKKLENITWPKIRSMIEEDIANYEKEANNKCIVVEAAILLEAGWGDIMDEIWVVAVDPDIAR